MKGRYLQESLDKYLEYIKFDPLNSSVHLQIGRIYILLHRQSSQKQENETTSIASPITNSTNLEESILHFEQVIKHCRLHTPEK